MAVLLFSIVVVTVFASFQAMYGKSDVVDGSLQKDQTALACMNRIAVDLQGLYAQPAAVFQVPDGDDSSDPYRVEGELSSQGGKRFPRLAFSSTQSLFSGGGVTRVVYYVTGSITEGFALRRAERWYEEGPFVSDPWDPVLCDSVDELQFEYLDAEGAVHDRWDSDDGDFDYATPAAVQIRLKLKTSSQERTYRTTVSVPVGRSPRS